MRFTLFLVAFAASNNAIYGDKMRVNALQKKALAILLISTLLFTFCSCMGVDPNVKPEKEVKEEEYEVEKPKDTKHTLSRIIKYFSKLYSFIKQLSYFHHLKNENLHL